LARAFDAAGTVPAVSALREFSGRGMEGEVDGRRVRVGSLAFCSEMTRNRAPEAPDGPLTRVYLADHAGFLAAFSLRDQLRPGSVAAVDELRAAGLRVHLLSGDHAASVAAVARPLGIEAAVGGATPEEKFAYVERLQAQGRVVAMVGDGLNDAPVLARADVSFAMAGGADSAQRQSDFVVMSASPEAVAFAIRLSRRAMRVVRQNFAWAIGYNALALPLAAVGWIGPWEAAVGMAASSFIVVLNATRLQPMGRESPSWKASTSSSLSRSPSFS
jgi:Cu2+-exporting ATPase